MQGRKKLSQLWYLSLDALVPHKAGGGFQSSPQPAPGSQDHQAFFLGDNQSGKQSQPPLVLAPASPKAPAQPPTPFRSFPIFLSLGQRAAPSLRLKNRHPCLLPAPVCSELEQGLFHIKAQGEWLGCSSLDSEARAGLSPRSQQPPQPSWGPSPLFGLEFSGL